MKVKYFIPIFAIVFVLFSNAMSMAQKGFFFHGGILMDIPSDKPFKNMKSGVGYIGSVGYNFFDRGGLEIGVLHSTHLYDIATLGNAIYQDEAEKNNVFLKINASAFKYKRIELLAGAGVGFYDITGNILAPGDSSIADAFSEGFSGWGYTLNIDFRYYITENFAATFYLAGNFVKYSNTSPILESQALTKGRPGGNSVSPGITFFYRVGIP